MKIVIDISEHYYEILKHDVEQGNDYKPIVLIANGTPLPKGHGRLIDADAVIKDFNSFRDAFVVNSTMGGVFKNVACVAPTIIEADKESE